MNFTLLPEQQMLQDSVRRYVEKDYGFDARTMLIQSGGGHHWQKFADNGWLAAALPETYGGLGGTLIDAVLIAQELGRGLVLEPYLGCAILAAQTLTAGGRPAQCEYWLPLLADGSKQLALAYSEAHTRGLAGPTRMCAERVSGGYRLHGTKTLVLGGAEADGYIISAQVSGTEGITLFLVEAHSAGLTRQVLPLHDGRKVAELMLNDLTVSEDAVLGDVGQGMPALEYGLSCGVAILCAELVGVMEKAIELTADYLKTRQQFGVAIGSFQALQHRMADMAAELELARSMLYALLASLMNGGAAASRRVVSQAKALVGRSARFVCGQAIQLHGGIGLTEEYAVGHYYKRAVVADLLLGSSDAHESLCASSWPDHPRR